MPYADAPLGELRWRAPQPVQPWAGIREASNFGPPCTQRIAAGTKLQVSYPDGKRTLLVPDGVSITGDIELDRDTLHATHARRIT